MGPQGLQGLASISLQRAHYLADKLTAIPGISLLYKQPFFNEFAITTGVQAEKLLSQLQERGILGGINLSQFHPDLDQALLVTVTEMNDVEELDNYAKALQEITKALAGEKSTRTSGSANEPICV
jgi:glycine dehydrogenase subunit 1